MLRVTEYFDKSLSALFIRNDSLEYGVYKSLLVFHCNYLVSWSYHFWDIQRPIIAWLKNLGYRSLKDIKPLENLDSIFIRIL